MNRRTVRYVVIGVVFFLIGLIHYLPAAVATGWIADRSALAFEGVTGTVFDGQAAYVSLPDGGIDNLHWQAHPLRLLLGHMSADVQAKTDLDTVSATFTRTLLGHNQVTNLNGQATIGWLAGLGGFTFVPISGQVDIHLDRLDFDDDLHVTGLDGRLRTTRTRYELLDPPLSLGRFDMTLDRQNDDSLRAAVTDSQGALAITGHADLVQKSSRYLLDVRLRARAGADARLKRVMTQLGQADDDGWYHIRERGRL